MGVLLTREEFRSAVFDRDDHKCVICGNPAVDPHHIMERKLWPDDGYYIDNGASLCEECHRKAEDSTFSPDDIREAAGIANVILPPQLPVGGQYDKWGNARYWKYPRTLHLPWSLGATDDDLILPDADALFAGKEVVITEKMDGENTTMYPDHIYARSLDSGYHPSRTWVKNLHGRIAHDIPEGWRIVGENLQAQHAIAYNDLESYFLVISIWDEANNCLSWDDTLEWTDLLGLTTVPVLAQGAWKTVELPISVHTEDDKIEGYVIRNAASFSYSDYQQNVAKYVRPNHVTADSQNWFAKPIVPNKLLDT